MRIPVRRGAGVSVHLRHREDGIPDDNRAANPHLASRHLSTVHDERRSPSANTYVNARVSGVHVEVVARNATVGEHNTRVASAIDDFHLPVQHELGPGIDTAAHDEASFWRTVHGAVVAQHALRVAR